MPAADGRKGVLLSTIAIHVEDAVARITLDRPDKRNAINDEMRARFVAALERAGNDETVRAVVLTGNGKSFCSGGDIAGMRDRLLPLLAGVRGAARAGELVAGRGLSADGGTGAR